MSGPAPKLCYAQPAECPHPPHVWYELDLSEPVLLGEVWPALPRYCDGYAWLIPNWLRGLRTGVVQT